MVDVHDDNHEPLVDNLVDDAVGAARAADVARVIVTARFSTIEDFLDAMTVPEQRARVEELLGWVAQTWPELELVTKLNQPMFLHHGTYIIGFSVFPKNIAVGPEAALIDRMRGDIEAAGYTTTQRLLRIGWDDPIDHALLMRIIDTQIAEKATTNGLWRDDRAS